MDRVPTVTRDQLQCLVEARRVGPVLIENRTDLFRKLALPRPHPGAVPPQRVDLPVVGQQPEWLGEPPGGEGVRGVPLVINGERRLVQRVVQIRVESAELACGAQRLVHDRTARERADVGLVALALERLSRQVQLALEAIRVRIPAAEDKDLADQRQRCPGGGAQGAGVHRHRAPAEHFEFPRLERPLERRRRRRVTLG